jgi:hypothetical protein
MVRALLAGTKTRKIVAKPGHETDPEHIAKRLANGLRINDATGCWEWQRSKNSAGYGTLTIKGRANYAHRWAFILGGGEIPAGHHVMHRCDNPACINPDHLTTGTRSDNMRDCHRKGRSRMPPPKLTRMQVDRIRLDLLNGEAHAFLASEYGVSVSQISRIRNRINWGDV